jgi:hypothetical protein
VPPKYEKRDWLWETSLPKIKLPHFGYIFGLIFAKLWKKGGRAHVFCEALKGVQVTEEKYEDGKVKFAAQEGA